MQAEGRGNGKALEHDERIISVRLILALIVFLTACSETSIPESDVYTMYSTNYPTEIGRSGVATFDLAREPLKGMMCNEAAAMHQADFEHRKRVNGWSENTKMRYWCEKGRFKK